MIGPTLTRLVIAGFGIVQLLLGIRLVLPFFDPPQFLIEWVPALVNITDVLIAPFVGFTDMLGSGLSGLPGGPLGAGISGQLDPTVIVALIGWSIVELIVVTVLRVFTRA
jgi:hypothetical protein